MSDATRWLVGEAGLQTVAAVVEAFDAGHDQLRIGTQLRRDGLAPERAALAVEAAEARRRARGRWPDADRLLFTRAALEQASDPEVARWRARRFSRLADRPRIWDLCAGLGGDTLAFAAMGANVTAVDRDEHRLALLEHNARARGHDVEIVHDDALSVRPPADALIHADPSRRDGHRRLTALRALRPGVDRLAAVHGGAVGVGIVLPPAVDLHDTDLPEGELEFVQVGERLVEAVVWIGALRDGTTRASATLLPAHASVDVAPWRRVRNDEVRALEAGPFRAVLVEVAPAAVRARLHDTVGRELDAHRIAANRALLTTATVPPPSPWYTAREIEVVLPARPRVVRRWLASRDDAMPVEIVLHGVEADPVDWWRMLGRPPRGPAGRRVELVRGDEGARAVVTRPVA